MAHYVEKRHFWNRPRNLNRISRIPFFEMPIGSYTITPSPSALSEELFQMMEQLLQEKSDILDSQNGNLFDNYIDAWKNLAKVRLEAQSVQHYAKIQTLVNVRESVKDNAEKWLAFEKSELEKIQNEIEKTEVQYDSFRSDKRM